MKKLIIILLLPVICFGQVDQNGTPYAAKTKLQAGAASDWASNFYQGTTSGAVTGTAGGQVFYGLDAISGINYRYEAIANNYWYRVPQFITPLSVANGGTGTSTPGLIQGANITITGTWPNQTISATGTGWTDASTQTNTGAKTFNDNTLLLRNVANTFSSRFTNANTAAQVYTLPNATGTLSMTGLAETFSAVKTFSAAPAFNVLPTGTAVANIATASTLVARDASNRIISANNIDGFTTTATSGGTTTLTVSSNRIQEFTGTIGHTVVLPTTSVVAGQDFWIYNLSSANLVVNSSAGNLVQSMIQNTLLIVKARVATPTTAANWQAVYEPFNGLTGTTVTTFSAGTTGFTPSTATSGAVTLGGILSVSNGGIGVGTLTGLAKGNGTGAFTAAATADVATAIGSQTANLVYASPNGAAGTPIFRNIVTADLANTTGSGTIIPLATSPTISTSLNAGTASFDLLNSVATSINFGGAATTFNLGGTPTGSLAATLFGNATASGQTKTVSIGTGGVAGSTTYINLGSSTGTNSINGGNSSLLLSGSGSLISAGSGITITGGTIQSTNKNCFSMFTPTTVSNTTTETTLITGGTGSRTLTSSDIAAGKQFVIYILADIQTVTGLSRTCNVTIRLGSGQIGTYTFTVPPSSNPHITITCNFVLLDAFTSFRSDVNVLRSGEPFYWSAVIGTTPFSNQTFDVTAKWDDVSASTITSKNIYIQYLN